MGLMNANTPFNPSLASKICGKRKASEAEEAEEKEATKISPVVFQNEEDPKETSTDEVFKKRRFRGKKLEALLREIEDLRCLLAEKQDAYDVLKRQYASIKKRLAKYVQQHCTKANVERDLELIRVKQKCQDLKQEILLLKKDDDNKGDNNEKGDDKETAEDKKIIQRLQEQISRKEEEAANDKKQVLRLCKEYLEKAGIKDVELESLRAQVEDLKTKLGNYKTQLSEKDKELGKKTDDNETLCAQVEDLKTKLGNYKTQLSEKDKELSDVQETSETLRAQ